jgi:hypothetical protein
VDGLISHDLIRKCHDAQPGQLCEGDGLCGTNNHMNNCHGIWDVYIRELPCAAPPPPPPSPTPPPNLILCKNLCYYTSDGDCDGAQRSHAYIFVPRLLLFPLLKPASLCQPTNQPTNQPPLYARGRRRGRERVLNVQLRVRLRRLRFTRRHARRGAPDIRQAAIAAVVSAPPRLSAVRPIHRPG